MKKIIWSEEAINDLRHIYNYYLQENPKAANKIYRQIRKDIRLLIKFPCMAPLELLLSDEIKRFRSLVIMHKFKIIYYIESDLIHISKIWDCRQNPEELIKKLQE